MFDNELWSWFIIVATLGGIAGLFWLTIALAKGKRPTPGTQIETMGHKWDGDLEEYNNPLPRWWLNLFYITMIFGVIYLVLFPGLGSFSGILGWSQTKQYNEEVTEADTAYGKIYEAYRDTSVEELAKNPEAMKTGHRLFVNYCSVCHGADASGVKGYPNLRDSDWLYGGDPHSIKTSVLQGRSGVMPAWQKVLNDEGVSNVAHYVMSLSGHSKADPALAEKGKSIYMSYCAACHTPEGKGMQALGAPNLTDKIWLYGGSPKDIIDSIAQGRNGKMPANEEFLGEDKAHVVSAYIYSLSQQAQ